MVYKDARATHLKEQSYIRLQKDTTYDNNLSETKCFPWR